MQFFNLLNQNTLISYLGSGKIIKKKRRSCRVMSSDYTAPVETEILHTTHGRAQILSSCKGFWKSGHSETLLHIPKKTEELGVFCIPKCRRWFTMFKYKNLL